MIAQRFIAGERDKKLLSESVQRTTDKSEFSYLWFSRPLHGLLSYLSHQPSSKLLGYFHSSAVADFLWKAKLNPEPLEL